MDALELTKRNPSLFVSTDFCFVSPPLTTHFAKLPSNDMPILSPGPVAAILRRLIFLATFLKSYINLLCNLLPQCDLTPTIRIMSAILNAANSSFKVTVIFLNKYINE